MSAFYKERIYPIIFMFLVTAVSITLVSGLFLTTEDIVRANEEAVLKRAVLYAGGIEFPDNIQGIVETFDERVEVVAGEESTYYRILNEDGSLKGYALSVTGPGLWGEIEAIVGFEPGLDTMTGIEFIKQNETPGLGARITERWFKEQFRNISPPLTLVPEGTENNGPSEIDALTGASRTSSFVLQLANKAPRVAEETVERGNN